MSPRPLLVLAPARDTLIPLSGASSRGNGASSPGKEFRVSCISCICSEAFWGEMWLFLHSAAAAPSAAFGASRSPKNKERDMEIMELWGLDLIAR